MENKSLANASRRRYLHVKYMAERRRYENNVAGVCPTAKVLLPVIVQCRSGIV